MNKLYPLKFKPLFKEKIWGGTRIKDMLGIDFGNLSNCGEAWILSGVKYNETVVTNGFLKGNGINELVEVYMDDLVGEKIFEKHKNEFPILVKLIDSNDYLVFKYIPMINWLPNGVLEMVKRKCGIFLAPIRKLS